MSKFKAGDWVYYPSRSNSVYKVTSVEENTEYPVHVLIESNYTTTFTKDGKEFINDTVAKIFPATEENHKLLERLYGMKFETPPSISIPKQIIQDLLNKGELFVPCWVSDDDDECPTRDNMWVFIHGVGDSAYPFNDTEGSYWKYATPFDIRTGLAITELPEGD